MSTIIGFVSNGIGIVASDGRIFPSVDFVDGKPVKLVTHKSDNFNKTFSLNAGKIIGAWCGLMESADGKPMSEIFIEIFDMHCDPNNGWDTNRPIFYSKVKERLENIPETEMLFGSRGLDMILIATSTGRKKNLAIYKAKFAPNDGTKEIAIADNQVPEDKFIWDVKGDNDAEGYIRRYLDETFKKNNGRFTNLKLFSAVMKRAIDTGIQHSGKPKIMGEIISDEQSCGGSFFSESI